MVLEVAIDDICNEARERGEMPEFANRVFNAGEMRLRDGHCLINKKVLANIRANKPIPPPSRGLGDTIAKMTSAVGIKPCAGCKRRQALANRLFPYTISK